MGAAAERVGNLRENVSSFILYTSISFPFFFSADKIEYSYHPINLLKWNLYLQFCHFPSGIKVANVIAELLKVMFQRICTSKALQEETNGRCGSLQPKRRHISSGVQREMDAGVNSFLK